MINDFRIHLYHSPAAQGARGSPRRDRRDPPATAGRVVRAGPGHRRRQVGGRIGDGRGEELAALKARGQDRGAGSAERWRGRHWEMLLGVTTRNMLECTTVLVLLSHLNGGRWLF